MNNLPQVPLDLAGRAEADGNLSALVRMRLAVTVALLCLWAMPSSAQVPGRTFRIGAIVSTERAVESIRTITVPELARRGFVESGNLTLDARVAAADGLPAAATELALLPLDAIIAIGNPAITAAKDATTTIPIVMIGGDPIELGFASSLARPGANITGVTIRAAELDTKRLDLLQEAVPGVRRMAVLFDPSVARPETSRRDMEAMAAAAGMDFLPFSAASPQDYASVFAEARAAGAQALLIAASPQFNRDTAVLARLAVDARLPTACHWPENAEQGCLLGYGPSLTDFFRRTADYVARILRGAAPSELPIEGPTHVRLAVNLKTAKALGLDLPPALLVRADDIIE